MHLTPTQNVFCLAGTAALTAASLTPGAHALGGLGELVGAGLHGVAGGAAWLLPVVLVDEAFGAVSGRQNAGKRRLHWFYGFTVACAALGLASSGGLVGRAIAGSLDRAIGLLSWVVVVAAAIYAGRKVLGPARCEAIAVHTADLQQRAARAWQAAQLEVERERIAKALVAQTQVAEPAHALVLGEPVRQHAAPPPLPRRRQPAPTHEDLEVAELVEHVEPETPTPRKPAQPRAWKLPNPLLLSAPAPRASAANERAELTRIGQHLSSVAYSHGVSCEALHGRRGPLLNTLELKPTVGTKITAVEKLRKEFQALYAGLQVIELPGTGSVGVTIPRAESTRQPIALREVLDTSAWRDTKAALPIAIGLSSDGAPVVIDLARAPHLLVAGTTGSGKSVGLHTMLTSLLLARSPAQVRLGLIDPKMVELSAFDGLPHLLAPVAIEDGDALRMLNWACAEMDRRYARFREARVNSLDAYNALGREPMPRIVLVVDEYADLVDAAEGDFEAPVQRLAQKARAAGIHVIIATQRPSTDVINGRIKNVFPSRISYRVPQQQDSVTILGVSGAQHLLGKGDSYVKAPEDFPEMLRVHGALTVEEDVQVVTNAWRAQGRPQYVDMGDGNAEECAGELEPEADAGDDGEASEARPHRPVAAPRDDYARAIAYARERGAASTGILTDGLKIGIPKAAKFLKRMDSEGYLEPGPSNAPRKFREPNSSMN